MCDCGFSMKDLLGIFSSCLGNLNNSNTDDNNHEPNERTALLSAEQQNESGIQEPTSEPVEEEQDQMKLLIQETADHLIDIATMKTLFNFQNYHLLERTQEYQLLLSKFKIDDEFNFKNLIDRIDGIYPLKCNLKSCVEARSSLHEIQNDIEANSNFNSLQSPTTTLFSSSADTVSNSNSKINVDFSNSPSSISYGIVNTGNSINQLSKSAASSHNGHDNDNSSKGMSDNLNQECSFTTLVNKLMLLPPYNIKEDVIQINNMRIKVDDKLLDDLYKDALEYYEYRKNVTKECVVNNKKTALPIEYRVHKQYSNNNIELSNIYIDKLLNEFDSIMIDMKEIEVPDVVVTNLFN